MSRNFYILFILLVCMQLVAKGQSTVTLFADSAVGKSRSIRAYAATNMSFQEDSILLKDQRGATAAINNFEHGYCVFNLAAAGIPAGATITSVSLGYYVSSISGSSAAYDNYYVNGVVGDLSSNNDTLNMISILKHDKLSNANALYVSSGTVGFGTTTGYNSVTLNRNLTWISKHADGHISLVWAQRSTWPSYARRYAITGYTGVASTSTPNHRPYLTITYIAPGTCSGSPAGGNTVAIPSAGDATTYHSLSLSGGTEASGLSYQWQRSTTATGTYTAITGATNRTYSFSGVSATFYYRCAISCGGSTSYSQPAPIFLIAANACRNPIYALRYYANNVAGYDDPMGQAGFNVTIWGDSSTMIEDSTVSTPMAYNNMVNVPSMQELKFCKGYDHPIQVRSGYVGQNWTAWMDYNDNGVFETTENIGGDTGSSYSLVCNSTLTAVPLSQAEGYYRLRIVSEYTLASNPCPTAYSRGMVRDYLVKVIATAPTIRSIWPSVNLGVVSRGIASRSESIIVNGRALVPDTGRLTVSVSAPFEISADSASWSTSYTVPYASRTYTDSVFVRCIPTTLGVFTDTLRVSGGGYANTLKIPLRAESRNSCSGIPVAGVTYSSYSTASFSTTFLLTLSGSSTVTNLSYQWQSSPTAISGSWTNITGATNNNHEYTYLRQTSFFRCIVRCASSGLADSSVPVRVAWARIGTGCLTLDSANSACAMTSGVVRKLKIEGSTGYLGDSASCSVSGYNDRTNLVLHVERGEQYTAYMTTGTVYLVSMQFWIDFNANGTFESTESVGGRVASRYSANCLLRIPASVSAGIYRMRVFATSSTPMYPSINPCGTLSFASARDYTVIVSAGFNPVVKDFGYQLVDSSAMDTTISFEASRLVPDSGYIRFRASANFGVSIADTVFRIEDSVFYRGGSIMLSRFAVHFRPRTAMNYNGFIRASGGGLDTSIAMPVSGIGVFTRCTGSASAGTISTSVLVADDTTNIPFIGVGCDTNGGLVAVWQQSTDSVTWWNIVGGVVDTLNYRGIMQKTFFRRAVYCYFTRTLGYSNVVVVHYPHRILADTISRATDCYQSQFRMRLNSGVPTMKIVTAYGDGTTDTLMLGTGTIFTWTHLYPMPGTYTVRYRLFKSDTLYDSAMHSYDVGFCNTIRFRRYYDLDSNCIRSSTEDYCIHAGKLRVDSAGIIVDTIAYLGGLNYSAFAPVGTIYRFYPIEDTAYWRVLCLGSGYFADTIRAGAYMPSIHYTPLFCIRTFYNFNVYSSGWLSRLSNGRMRLYTNRIRTRDTTAMLLKYRISPRMRMYNVLPTPFSISTDSLEYSWLFTRYSSGGAISLSLRDTSGLFTVGDTMYSVAEVGPLSGDRDISDNFSRRCDTVVASYDPNYIASDPSGCITSGIITEYTVGFENTGNDTAYNVHVLDTLSGYLDPRTLVPIMSSHFMVMETRHIAGLTIVKFDFPNIKLLDSSQPHGNHGMFKYKIRVRSGLADGTLVSSRVGIYFDNNDVVMTNTQVNTINCPVYVSYPTVESAGGSRVLGSGALDADNLGTSDEVKIYPNPVNDELHIEASLMHYDQCIVTNTMGTIIHAFTLQRNHQVVSTAKWPTGIYFVQLKGTSGTKTIKLMKL